MKIRWTEESLRLRITPVELERLEQRLPIETALTLAPGGGWRVELSVAGTATELSQVGNMLRIALSDADLTRLSAPDSEGVYFHMERADGVRFYIEKDFPCAHPRGVETLEPQTQTFAAPGDFEERKTGSAAGTDKPIGK